MSAALLLAPTALAAKKKKGEEPPPPPPLEINLGAPFRDGAVLQRESKAPVWGWSKPGVEVTVEFAGQKKSATAGADGKWMLHLDPLKTSAGGREMTVREKDGKTVILKDLLVGEVWMASGQSNMQWVVGSSSGRLLVEKIKKQSGENGALPPIREFKVTNRFAQLHPIEHAEGAWGKDYNDFSAVAFAFAHKVHEEIGVPIGILNCSFSQTSIEAWTPRIGFKDSTTDYNKKIEAQLLETDPSTPEHKTAWDTFYNSVKEAMNQNQKAAESGKGTQMEFPKLPGNMAGNRDATWLYNARIHPVVPYALRGCIWNQGYANMGGGILYYENLHALIRGWRAAWVMPELPVYFHQFYSSGYRDKSPNHPAIGGGAEMRLGTWMARDIPHTGMASQIDIQGAIHYFHKTVPGQRLALHALKNQYGKIAGVEADPSTVGLLNDYRKMPILSSQFVDNAVLQAGQPITFWGSAVHDWGHDAKGEAVIHFHFDGVEKTIPVVNGMKEWSVTLPAMEASDKPCTLKVTFTIDGELAHERVAENIVIGDVWYVVGQEAQAIGQIEDPVNGPIRVMTRMAKGFKTPREHKYSVSVSNTPGNRFGSYWGEPAADGFASTLAKAIHAKTGKPVGIILMDGMGLELKHWMDIPSLATAPSLKADYENIAAITPGTPFYLKNAERYLADWKKYWSETIPTMIATKDVPDDSVWGSFPEFDSEVNTDATQTFNFLVSSFRNTQIKGSVFMAEQSIVAKDQGTHFGSEMSALANGWKRHFRGEKDPHFIYTLPAQSLVPGITKPSAIVGASTAFEIGAWHVPQKKPNFSAHPYAAGLVEAILKTAY